MYKIKVCIICGEEFKPNIHNQKCCDKSCMKENKRISSYRSYKKLFVSTEKKQIICKICGKKFIPNSNYQKCCDEECKKQNKKQNIRKWSQVNKGYRRNYMNRWYQIPKNREKKLIVVKKYRDNNPEKVKKNKAKWKKNNLEKVNANKRKYYRKSFNNNKSFKMIQVLRSRLYNAIKSQSTEKSTHALDLIGCSINYLKQYLEGQFTTKMNWDNHGQFGWHIDHRIPCAKFDLTRIEEQKECFHYTNLQPLWWTENLSKGSKVISY